MAKSGDVQDERSGFLLLQNLSTAILGGNDAVAWMAKSGDVYD